MLDLAIRNGWIIDGTGSARYRTDVGIADEKIVSIGRVPTARVEIDATELIVAPGFVDPHSHSDFTLHSNRDSHSSIRQGVTTEIVGNCGMSNSPYSPASEHIIAARMRTYAFEGTFHWPTFGEYLRSFEVGGISANVACFVGHSTIRSAAGVFGKEEVTEKQLKTMAAYVAEAMEAGALGMSTGLEFTPGTYSKQSELEYLAKELGRYNGIYTSHVRNRDSRLFESIQELLDLARIGNIPAQISHFNVRHDTNAPENGWALAVEMMMKAKAQGLDISADTTPFKYGLGQLSAILPDWLIVDGYAEAAKALKDNLVRDRVRQDCDRYWRFIHKGQWERVRLSGDANFPEFSGMTITAIAKIMKKDEWDTFFDIMMRAGEEMDELIVIGELFTDEHLAEMISHPEFSLGVDGYTSIDHGPLGDVTMSQHPYSGHIEYLAHHVREKKTITLETAVHKMTTKPAKRFGIANRGTLKEGYFADIVLFDADRVRSAATPEVPRVYPEGIRLVTVNGTIVVDNGTHTGARTGRVLRKIN
jgi:N-acyl-D-amino-acid deacylase